jgi:hypothetical protein
MRSAGMTGFERCVCRLRVCAVLRQPEAAAWQRRAILRVRIPPR